MTVEIAIELSEENFVIGNLVSRKLKVCGLGRVAQTAPFDWLHFTVKFEEANGHELITCPLQSLTLTHQLLSPNLD